MDAQRTHRELVAACLLALKRCTSGRAQRGHYVWRSTVKKELAAKLVAKGYSQRSIARLARVNRRSIARWLRRREFAELVMRYQLADAIATGALREFNGAAESRERAAEVVSKQLDRGVDQVDAEMLRAMRDHRHALHAERAAEGRLRIGAFPPPRR